MTRGVLRPSANFSIFKPGGTPNAAIRSEVASRGAGFTMLLWVVVSPGILIPCAKAAAGNPATRAVAARHGKTRHGKIKCLMSDVLLCVRGRSAVAVTTSMRDGTFLRVLPNTGATVQIESPCAVSRASRHLLARTRGGVRWNRHS